MLLSFLLLFWHLCEFIFFVSLELEKVVMVLPESLTMTDSNQSDTLTLHIRVEMTFDINRDSRGTLIKDGILRLMVNQTSHSNSLLLTTREHIFPFSISIKSISLSLNHMGQFYLFHNFIDSIVIISLCFHLLNCVWVNDLISQGSIG